jgi:hypothetical protein
MEGGREEGRKEGRKAGRQAGLLKSEGEGWGHDSSGRGLLESIKLPEFKLQYTTKKNSK